VPDVPTGLSLTPPKKTKEKLYWLLGSHDGNHEDPGLLGCNSVCFEDSLSLLPVSADSCLIYSFTLNVKAMCFSETSGSLRTTWRYNPEDHTLPFKLYYRALKRYISK
jgi:hypothetical protein